MDVELQILKHLKRDAQPTVGLIDEYCESYSDLFPEVRSYECFKYLHQGIISPLPRKSLPEIAKIVGISSAQSLHHFIAQSPWKAEKLKVRSDELERERIPHPQWSSIGGWKNTLNNFRLIVQPTMVLWLLFPWLEVFPDSSLLLGLHDLIYSVNQLSLAPLSG